MLKTKNIFGNEVSQKGIADPRKYRTAIDIQDLLRWTYQNQAADEVSRKGKAGLYPAGYRSNLLAIERNGLLGTKIDCADSAAQGGADMHPDAEAVHDAVRTLKPLWIGLVIDCAKTGGEPDWMPGIAPKPEAILRDNGKPLMEYNDPGTCRQPAYCLLRYDPEPEHLAFLRSVYVAWWDAMATLVTMLQGLESYAVSGPNLPREPWLN